jgi:hypothetical protein
VPGIAQEAAKQTLHQGNLQAFIFNLEVLNSQQFSIVVCNTLLAKVKMHT